ncbi:6-bladed beta-propeller [Candidatus Aminicenantes bacterium AC-335-K20]|jgi:hypothetical protein|nr:6-bladed beta-propeller [SCandidatus Aminicenantes bacterium Aminicenantia_JdfR_composite]MCP2596706.1 6-bladed beta-propeller [Candidatus Aminicenantes bacterium AC-335-G13]MCP2619422.1 6-bladed beta-propeller [Candidatus Aminicenantes bacterium AC-335-K20]
MNKEILKFWNMPILFTVLIMIFSVHSYEQIIWKGEMEIKESCKIVKNSRKPLCGKLKLVLEKNLIIGDIRDENKAFFHRVFAYVDQKGNIYILDSANSRIQKFNKDGKFIQSVGKKGQGPGEFQLLSHFFLVDEDENIFIYDFSARKLHRFDSKGKFVKLYHFPFRCESFAITSEGNFLTNDKIFSPEGGVEAVNLINSEGNILKTIATFPNIMAEGRLKQKARFFAVIPELYLYPLKQNSAVFGYSAEYKIYKVDSKGNIIAIIEKDEPRRRVSRKEKNHVIKNLIKVYGRGNKRNEQDIRKRTFFSTYKPFFDKILADEDGCIFVRRYRIWSIKDKDIIYDFFDEKGKFLYELRTTKDALVIKNGYLYTSEYDRKEECFKLVRYKIKNWSRIKSGCN